MKRNYNEQKNEEFEKNLEKEQQLDVKYDTDSCGPSTSAHAEKRIKTEELDITDDNYILTEYVTTKSIGTQTNLISLDTSDFRTFKKEVIANINGIQRSILYKINKLEEKLDQHFSTPNKSCLLKDIEKKLNIEQPITDLAKFYEFDTKIKNDNEFRDSLREFLSYKTKAKYLHKSIGNVLSTIMSQDLQLKFSGCGKPNKGVCKENFSATQTYLELKDFLLKQFASETESSILSKISRWLASAKDRSGGRNFR